ncbi:MAG: flagellar type III secretion system protein FlhB [Pseudomonadota bacterium]
MSGGQQSSTEEKSHAPSQKRRDDARKKGQAPRAPDAGTALAYLAFYCTLALAGEAPLNTAMERLAALLGPQGGHEMLPLSPALLSIAAVAAPLLIAPILGVLLANGLMGSFAPSLEGVRPKWQRIDPIAQAKQKWGTAGWVEFAKTLAKFTLIGAGLTWIAWGSFHDILQSLYASAGQLTAKLGELLMRMLAVVTGIAFCIGALDMLWQRYKHEADLRMTHKEVRDEQKEAEGDPFLKAQRRRRGEEIATNRMISDMADASVVIVNPTHYAVALRWRFGDRGAPVCLAKGTDEVAARIRARAAECGIPIRYDPPTARALHATVKLGQEIPEDLYRAVAAALRYAESLKSLTSGDTAR